MRDSWKEFWADYADSFIQPLKANGQVGKFVNNSAVTGLYAEAWIRDLVKSMLPHFRVSSGAIIGSADRERDNKIPQCDIIIWDPSELPALFEKGDFALVPKHSVKALIEVKRSSTNIRKFKEQLKRQQKCLFDSYRILGVIISHKKQLFKRKVTPDWLQEKEDTLDRNVEIIRIFKSLNNNKLKQNVDAEGIFAFIYFLSQIAGISNTLPTK